MVVSASDPCVERDLPPRVAHLGPEVVPVQVAEFVAPRCRASQRKNGVLGLTDIRTEVLPGLEVNILDDVGGVDPTLEPRVEPEAHHPAQPRSVPLHQLRPAPGVACGGLLHQGLVIARFYRHLVHHDTLIGAKEARVTATGRKKCRGQVPRPRDAGAREPSLLVGRPRERVGWTTPVPHPAGSRVSPIARLTPGGRQSSGPGPGLPHMHVISGPTGARPDWDLQPAWQIVLRRPLSV